MSEASLDVHTIRGWLSRARSGALSTLLADARAPGAPFGSVVPYALDDDGVPFFVLSELAVHSKNLHADARASLLISEPDIEDPQAGWRVTLIGRVHRMEGNDADPLLARYRAAFPGPVLSGFFPWRMNVGAVRYLAGFGKMGWLDRF